jgi:hypothetical protein
MNSASTQELKRLMEQTGNPCISLYFPMHHRAGVEMQQDPIQLKNQLREVERLLLARNLDSEQITTLFEPIEALFTQEEIWQHPTNGLAILRSPESFHIYQLPFHCQEHIVVGTHFYLKPLLPFLTSNERFYILALSLNAVRFLEATRYTVREINVPASVPTNLAEAMQYDEPENELQYHSSSAGPTTGSGNRQPVIFHGQGVGTDDEKTNILRYFQQIDRGLHEFLHDQTAPLILAAVSFLLPIYHEANTYAALIPEGITGNPEKQKGRGNMLLHKEAWPIVAPYVQKQQQDDRAQFEENKETDWASANVSAIVQAAYHGRIASLFLALDEEQWGTFDPRTSTIHLHETADPGDEDVLDLAATQTILHGGTVYALERKDMPDHALLAALYRY